MKITVLANGPYLLEIGGRCLLRLEGREVVIEKPQVALCRCGGSANKPFCDGTHSKKGFAASGGELVLGE